MPSPWTDRGSNQIRVIASGSDSIAGMGNVFKGPYTRNAGERIYVVMFPEEQANITWDGSSADVKSTLQKRVDISADEFKFFIENNLASPVTVDWIAVGIAP